LFKNLRTPSQIISLYFTFSFFWNYFGSMKKFSLLPFFVALLLVPSLHAAPKEITGIFDAGWNSFFRDSSGWDKQCERIRSLGMNTVIFQYSIEYPNTNYVFNNFDWAEGLRDEQHLEIAVPAAERHDLEIFIGLYAENQDWWFANDEYLDRQKVRMIQTIELFETKFPSSSVVGYYIPHEIARYYWHKPADLARLKGKFLKPVVDYIHQNTNKKVLISPFFNPDLATATEIEEFFYALLDSLEIDILALQDGVASMPSRIPRYGEYIRGVSRSAQAHGVDFWLNIEIFKDNEDPDYGGPSGMELTDRIRLQIDTANTLPHCSKWISYDYSSITADHYAHTMNALFDTLTRWHEELPSHLLPSQNSVQKVEFLAKGKDLIIHGAPNSPSHLALYSLTGNRVFDLHTSTLDQPFKMQLRPGAYVVQLRTEKDVIRKTVLFRE